MTKGKALSIAQKRLWVLERLHPDNPANNISYGLRLTGPLDIDQLQHAWSEVIQRHEILRTVFRDHRWHSTSYLPGILFRSIERARPGERFSSGTGTDPDAVGER